jgi:hypothetical protein
MISESQIDTYLKNEIAIKNKLIAHTDEKPRYASSIEVAELLSKKNLDMLNFILIKNIDVGSFSNNDSDSEVDAFIIELIVVKQIKSNDPDMIMSTEDQSKEILRQILTKIYRDYSLQNTVWQWLQKQEKAYEKMSGVIIGNLYGYKLSLTLRSPLNLQYDTDQWL